MGAAIRARPALYERRIARRRCHLRWVAACLTGRRRERPADDGVLRLEHVQQRRPDPLELQRLQRQPGVAARGGRDRLLLLA